MSPKKVKKDKEPIFSEIKETIKFLIKEREFGREEFELQDFFNDDLAENIVGNFDGIITVKEYENCILDLFGIKQKKSRFSITAVEKEVVRLIKVFNIKSKDLIFNKIFSSLDELDEHKTEITNVINKKYEELVAKKSLERIQQMLERGFLNNNSILKVLEKDGYELNPEILKKLIKMQKRRRHRVVLTTHQTTVSRRQISKKKLLQNAEKQKKAKEQLRQTIKRKEKNKKDRFISRYTRMVKFDLKDQVIEGKNKLMVHTESFQGKEIKVSSFMIRADVANVKLEIRPQIKRQKGGVEFDVLSYAKMDSGPKKASFFQKAIKALSSYLGFGNIQEGIWFLTNILLPGKKLPPKTCQFLDKHFTSQLKELNEKISEIIIERSIR